MELALITCPEALADTPGILVKAMSQYQCKKNVKSILQLIHAKVSCYYVLLKYYFWKYFLNFHISLYHFDFAIFETFFK